MANWMARAQVLSEVEALPINESPAASLKLVTPPVSPQVAEELRALIGVILAGDSDAERAEAFAVAIADPDAALICFRDLAAQVRARSLPPDDRRTCGQCAELSGRGECRAVARGQSIGIATTKPYHAIPDLLLRCIGYQPKAEDFDTRTGRERWFGEEASDGR